MTHDPYKALYIHIPFCASRCRYCDFETAAVPIESTQIDDYIDLLNTEIRRWAKQGELDAIETIYLGGGTPTHIGNKRLTSLLYMLSVSLPQRSNFEWSMEANPESLTEALVKDAWAMGVNRLSMGVQSFDDGVLAFLGRPHTALDALRAIETARTRFENVSIDLICGIPGQTLAGFCDDVKRVAELGLGHLSVYPLTIEEHTPLYADMLKGRIPDVDPDEQAEMMIAAAELLTSVGMYRYEVASYAKPGFECKHNIAYWTGVPYLGIGTSAASMTQDATHRMRMQNGQITDDLDRAGMEAEDLMLMMRMAQGVGVERVAQAEAFLPEVRACFDELEEMGLVELRDNRYRPTDKGWLCGNELYGRIFDLA